ncbi:MULTISPECIES: [LysW]-lysine hydrolase [Thermococcus]|uniref:Putative [LysW]-lysine/[LysW]-ornithine hydrolase n=1 Tax=Thermococcus sibiricus TaxID=172049 RepID=A0A101EM76_9EURY|nr:MULTISPECIES: [LysW]-lysine hydrolase [Thermococcus]KUK17922.1 MAG: Acetyl-lysine deacetylase [Thermococcus sibiricus]KUK29337.1 MAG: Acetyl-lysine deacetylase [Thermococcus sp. 40_45]MBC7094641.1 [LysW]-lysine hydrolase [Thermococcus sp.]HII67881.1 [LysW]-lysine hydrolase [Thermococcaceae archaeon]
MVSEEEKIELLKELVSIYSPSGEEEKVAKFLVESLESFGVEAYIDEVGNVIAEKRGKGNRILLAGHMDTVKGMIPVRIENNYLWGRGSVDAKGALATFFFAFIESKANLIFASLVDEEGFSKGAKNLSVSKPDFIIIGEPSGFDGVTIGYKGSLTMKFTEKVEKFHGSLNSKGAAERLIEKWLELSKDFGEGFYRPNGRILKFEAYERDFDFYAEMIVNIRTPIDYEPPIKGEILDFVPAYEVSPRSPLVRTFVRAIRKEGIKPRLKKKSGTADMNILAPKFKVDAVAYGPGDSKLDHTPYERLNLEKYLKAIEILKTALEELKNI